MPTFAAFFFSYSALLEHKFTKEKKKTVVVVARRVTMKLSPLQIHRLANSCIFHKKSRKRYSRMGLRQFASFFGCTPAVVSAVWNRIDKKKEEIGVHPDFTPTKLLWTLCFLKIYASETVLCLICECTEKTLRKWVWKGIDILADLDLVSREYCVF